ncbi:MAG: multidrug effflux MFS transporter [Sphingomonadaceae bacterium]
MTSRLSTGGSVAGRKIIFMLAGIAALGSLAIHIMVPTLPFLAHDLGVSAHAAQQVISFYLFGLAAGQLLVGPIIDRLGGKPVLLAGLFLYAVAAAWGALADGPVSLLAARVLQAFGGSAGLVTSRVLVGDLFERSEAGRRQATLMGVVLLSPAVAPVIGGVIAEHTSWRVVLGLLSAIGLSALLLSWKFLPGGNQATKKAEEGHALWHDYERLLKNARFLRAAIAIAAASSGLYMFLAVSPFLLVRQWGLDADQAGWCYLLAAGGGILGTLMVGRLEGRADVMRVGLSFSMAGGLLVFASALSGAQGWPFLILPVTIMTIGAGMAGPAGIAIIIHSEAGLSGTASSLAGALQMVVAGGLSSFLGILGPPSFLLLGVAMALVCSFAWLVGPRSHVA